MTALVFRTIATLDAFFLKMIFNKSERVQLLCITEGKFGSKCLRFNVSDRLTERIVLSCGSVLFFKLVRPLVCLTSDHFFVLQNVSVRSDHIRLKPGILLVISCHFLRFVSHI